MTSHAVAVYRRHSLTPLAFAQDDNEHVQVGVFADYLRLSQGRKQFWRSRCPGQLQAF
jgi:hypothetical protein